MAFLGWEVFVDGEDKTSALLPSLISITVSDKEGGASDTCQIELDDTDGAALLPRDKSEVLVRLYGRKIFEGTVDKVRSRGSRSGRLLSVSAKGFDPKGKAKDGQRWHKDDATLGEAMEHAGKKAGFTVKVDPELAGIKRDYWSPDGASFLAWGQKIAREHNATFKLRGDKAVLVPRGKAQVPPIVGTIGEGGNVISWDIAPIIARPKVAKATARHFDRDSAEWVTETEDVGSERAEATIIARFSLADSGQAKEALKGRKGEAEQGAGAGSASLNATPDAQVEAVFKLSGARKGVDGAYRVSGVTHKCTRSAGTTTDLELKQPQGGAGKDERRG